MSIYCGLYVDFAIHKTAPLGSSQNTTWCFYIKTMYH